MARWRGREPEPVLPDWIRHEADGGFVVSDWAEASDFRAGPGCGGVGGAWPVDGCAERVAA